MIEQGHEIIYIENIIKLASVWLEDLPKLMSFNFYVLEILYHDVSTNHIQI